MVTIEQVKAGVLKYVETDMLPKIMGWKKIALGAYVALASENFTEMTRQYWNHPAVAVLNVFDATGNADIDKVYNAMYPMMANGEKITIPIPVVGDYTADRSDLEKIYRYIRG